MPTGLVNNRHYACAVKRRVLKIVREDWELAQW